MFISTGYRKCVNGRADSLESVVAPFYTQPVARRPTPSDKLVAVQTFFTCKEGGACQVGNAINAHIKRRQGGRDLVGGRSRGAGVGGGEGWRLPVDRG